MIALFKKLYSGNLKQLNSRFFWSYKHKWWIILAVIAFIFLHFFSMRVFPNGFLSNGIPLLVIAVLLFYVWIQEIKDRCLLDLIESVQNGVYLTDTEGNLLFANNAAANILGYESKEELIEHNIVLKFDADSHARENFLEKLKKRHMCIIMKWNLLKKMAPHSFFLSQVI